MWALSEAALGGVLHTLKIPLTGLFIGSAAVIFISLIGYYSGSKKEIFKSMMIVIFVKAAVSPFTPPMAYLAVFLQGVIGSALFYSKRAYRAAAVLFGVIVLLLSAFQKIFFFTLIYGNNLWRSIDEFGSFITEKLPVIGMVSSMSVWIIGIYAAVHLCAGLTAGLIAAGLPSRIGKTGMAPELPERPKEETVIRQAPVSPKRKIWVTRFSGILIAGLAFSIVVFTYIFPHFSESVAVNAVIMIVRSILVMGIWFFVLSPYLTTLFKRYSGKGGNRYSGEIRSVMEDLPRYRTIVSHCWTISKGKFLPFRLKEFIVNTFALILRDGEGRAG